MDKQFLPNTKEKEIYKFWKQNGFFRSQPDNKKPFTIMIPPPNVTGSLHMGHALNNTIIDTLIRYSRMKGKNALYQPGTDHAGIATQNKVEQKLAKEGKFRTDLGRDEFEKEVWKWKEHYQKRILSQLELLGCSCDWQRNRFTLDNEYSKAVNQAFINYYKKGWIYQGTRVINWCPRCQTSISDIEVEHKPQKTKLYYFKYDKNFPITIATTRPETKLGDIAVAINPKDERYKKFVDQEFEIDFAGIKRKIKIVADRTVDPEFGTGAVGITPAHSMIDEKIGHNNKLESIKVIDENGKITKNIGADFVGLNIRQAREKILDWLEKNNLLEKTEEIENNLSVCSRCGTAIEPLPSKQWFVKMKELAQPAIDTVKQDKIKFEPKRWKKVYLNWLENIEDWCISRQLWWGHRLPVYFSNSEPKIKNQKTKSWNLKIYGEDIFNPLKDNRKTIELRAGKPKDAEKYWGDFNVGDTIEFSLADEKTDQIISTAGSIKKIIKKIKHFDNFEELFKIYKAEQDYPGVNEKELKNWWLSKSIFKERIEKYGIWVFELENISEKDIYVGENPPTGYTQSEDVLDTWFSSALWPFATLGWPEKTKDLKYYYPTQILSTARDILYLWVARMIFSSIELIGKIPFEKVYIHPTILNKEGKIMSKSKGTGIDALDLIEKYGPDATRFGLLYQNTGIQDVRFSEDAIMAGKKFANKIWNASRFVLMQLENTDSKKLQENDFDFSENDKKVLAEIENLTKELEKNLENFDFGKYAHSIYNFFWYQFCDKTIEDCKSRIYQPKSDSDKLAAQKTIWEILKKSLKLLHPAMPFITEEIWQNCRKFDSDLKESIMISQIEKDA